MYFSKKAFLVFVQTDGRAHSKLGVGRSTPPPVIWNHDSKTRGGSTLPPLFRISFHSKLGGGATPPPLVWNHDSKTRKGSTPSALFGINTFLIQI